MDRLEAANKAIDTAGGPAALSRALLGGDAPKSEHMRMQWRIAKWRTGGVPPEYVYRVSELTGVSRSALAPDVFPSCAA